MKTFVYRENLGTLHQRRINKSPPQNPRTPIKFYKENGIWFFEDNAPLSIIYLHRPQNVKFGSIVSRDAIWFLQKRESNLTQIWSKNQIRFSRTMRTIWSDQNFLWNVQNLINFCFKKCIFFCIKWKNVLKNVFACHFSWKKLTFAGMRPRLIFRECIMFFIHFSSKLHRESPEHCARRVRIMNCRNGGGHF